MAYGGDFLSNIEEEFLLVACDGEGAFLFQFNFLHVLDVDLLDQFVVVEGPGYS